MTDVKRLMSAFETGEFLRPRHDVANLVDLTRALATLAGVEGLAQSPASLELADRIGPAEHLVFVLADGLGMNFVETMPEGSFLAANLTAELCTVFPSTTAVALTTIATGEWPGRHAVTGWWTHLPQIGAATILPFVTRADGKSLSERRVTPSQAFPVAPLMPRMQRDTLSVLPEKIVDSAYSVYSTGDGPRLGYKTLSSAIDAVLERVRVAEGPTYTYVYTLAVDEAAHQYGVARPEVRAAVLDFDSELRRLSALLDGRARIVVSADHGFLDVPQERRHQLTASHELATTLRFPPSGDARVLNFHVDPVDDDRFRRSFHKRFGDHFLLLTTDEVQCQELLGPGPLSAETNARLGDYLAISRGADIVEYRPRYGQGKLTTLPSHHSGLSRAEMRIPLLII